MREERIDNIVNEAVITAGTVLPGPTGEALTDAAVHVRDGRILAVGPAEAVLAEAPHAARRDFPDSTIVPGLIDAHVHLVLDGGPASPERFASSSVSDDVLVEQMRTRAAAALLGGVTTLRDVGDSRGLVQRLRGEGSEHTLPRILTAGTPITRPGGEAAFLGGAVDDSSQLPQTVKAQIDAGADLISVIGSGGHLGLGGPPFYEAQFTADELGTIVSEAHAHGVPVVVHAHAADAIAAAAAAGVDEIEHATWAVGGREIRYDPSVARELAERDIAVCMIQSVNWRRVVAALDTATQEAMYGKLRKLDELGVPLIAGSRAGTSNAPFSNFVDSLEAYHWAGLTCDTVLEAATTRAAHRLGIGDQTGQLKPGLAADLLVVDGDPREDLGALRRIQHLESFGTAGR